MTYRFEDPLTARLRARVPVLSGTLAGNGDGSIKMETTEVLANKDGPEAAEAIEFLKGALERISRNFDLLLAGKPVRDVAETKAEVAEALLRFR